MLPRAQNKFGPLDEQVIFSGPMTFLYLTRKFICLLFLTALTAAAQTNFPVSNTTNNSIATNETLVAMQLKEQLRAECIEGRRVICGKILRVFPTGLLVEGAYTNLLRKPLTKSWLAPGSVTASRATNFVESKEPGAICNGTVFLTDLPRGKPHQYDYVIITGYPIGSYTYTSVGTIQKTVRSFSANLDKAVKEKYDVIVQKKESHSGDAK